MTGSLIGLVCLLWRVLFVFADSCNSTQAFEVNLSFHEQQKVIHRGKGDATWAFHPTVQEIAVVVTPSNSSIDPDMRLFITSRTTGCLPVFNSQEFGGDYMRIHPNLTTAFNVSQYFLHVSCRGKVGCHYHIAFSQVEDDWQELKDGDQRPGIAYHGVPSHFKFVCGTECKHDFDNGKKKHITFSAWPRDATSTKHLLLLVRFGKPPVTTEDHLNASRGWFSGEVARDEIKEGTYYITVLKRHGFSPIPFVVSVTLPHSIQWLKLGRPTFGIVKKSSPSFYKFYVDSPETDIEVYLTKLDGDPDCAMSHEKVNLRPTHLTSQWRSSTQGDDEISVPSDDPKRRENPTGWFHIGVHSLEDSTFSIIAFAEKHLRPAAADTDQGKDGYVVEWTELWLGLPQAMGAQPGRPANFLFFSRLATSKLYVNVEALEGNMPDVCVHNCGPDPHRCPWLPIYLGEKTRAKVPQQAVSFCPDGAIRGYSSERQVIVSQPCTDCWYAILVTSESNRSRFKIQLGQAGRAHPLVDGEPFKSNADADDSCPLFVYDLPQSVAETRRRGNATLRLSVTPIYGNPTFDVRKDAEDSNVLFNSLSGGNTWRLSLAANNTPGDLVSGAYFVKVCASGAHHAQFRIQASWDQPLSLLDSSTKLGFGMLRNGEAQIGNMPPDKHDVYLYVPATSEANSSIRVSVTSMSGNCNLFVLAPRGGTFELFKDALRTFIENPAANADWKEVEKEAPELVIAPSDAKYVPLNSLPYIFLVSSRDKSAVFYEITASTLGLSGGIEELRTTGLPLRGQVGAKEYRRYSISVAEANQDLSIQLTAEVGDCDLYVGRSPDVSSDNFDWRSEAIGSDSVFINGMGRINERHCDIKTISEKNDCVYYVAVKGVSSSAFTILATVPSLPVPLPLSQMLKVTLPPGGIQQYFTPLVMLKVLTSLQVSCSGLKNVTVKVLPPVEAKRFYRSERPSSRKANLSATFFAGAWSLALAPERLSQLCSNNCTVVSTLEAGEVQSECTLSLEESRIGTNSSSQCQLLEEGSPSRGQLQGSESVCFSLRIPFESDVAVSVSPLTDCHPRVEAKQSGKPTLLRQRTEGFISDTLHKVPTGLLKLEVSAGPGECQFDVRASIIDESTLRLSQIHSTAVTLDASVFSSTAGTAFFSLTKQAGRIVNDSAQVIVMSLVGEVQVDCSSIALETSHSQHKKRHVLEEVKKAMKPATTDRKKGFGVYVCTANSQACESECQLFLRIRSRRPGRSSDFVVTAMDRTSTKILYPGLPMVSCLGPCGSGGGSMGERYQLFIRNPSAIGTLRLSCQGQLRKRKCSQVVLSADSRFPLPQRSERAYVSHKRDMIDGAVQMELKASPNQVGRCRVPCILYIEVELLPGEFQSTHYQLEALLEEKFSLLLDGGMPLQFVAHPGKPEYFLFNSRQVLSTVTVEFPYDALDPENSLVRMYILDCDSQESDSDKLAEDAYPSAELFSRIGTLNSRWQLTALQANTAAPSRGSHCFGVKVAVISNRVHPVAIGIRGFGWHPGMPLLLGESLEGLVDGAHAISYELTGDNVKEFSLSLEVCAGSVHLQTSSPPDEGPGQSGHDFRDGFSNIKMPFEPNKWIQVSSMNGEHARYVISAEASKETTWLDAGNERKLYGEERGADFALAWQPVRLQGQRGGEDPNAQYEVFYIPADMLGSNFGTACGMYLEHTMRHAKRIITHNLNIVIQDLEPGTLYHLNVLARSLTTGHVLAFQPTQFVSRWEKELTLGSDGNRSWGSVRSVAMLLVGMTGFVWCYRQCTGQKVNAMIQRIELPSWRSSPQHYRSLEGRTIGSYSQF